MAWAGALPVVAVTVSTIAILAIVARFFGVAVYARLIERTPVPAREVVGRCGSLWSARGLHVVPVAALRAVVAIALRVRARLTRIADALSANRAVAPAVLDSRRVVCSRPLRPVPSKRLFAHSLTPPWGLAPPLLSLDYVRLALLLPTGRARCNRLSSCWRRIWLVKPSRQSRQRSSTVRVKEPLRLSRICS